MKAYGGYIVTTEDKLGTPAFNKLISDLPRPKLALNCVGGQSATEMARLLADRGTMVTYGGMSRKPVQVPTSLLIFRSTPTHIPSWLGANVRTKKKKKKMCAYLLISSPACRDISLRGFWLSRWVQEHSEEERLAMINECWDLVKSKQLRMWMERHSFSDNFNQALQRATEAQRNRKVLLVMKQH